MRNRRIDHSVHGKASSLTENQRMQNRVVQLKEDLTFVRLLKVCAQKKDLLTGSKLHDDIVKTDSHKRSPYVASALISMYAKCGLLVKAQQVLDEIHIRDAICWNALIAGYTQQGRGKEALDCLWKMQKEGIAADDVTFICILKACGAIGAIDKGKEIHDDILSRGMLGKSVMLGNALVDMYAKCGRLQQAQEVLENLPLRNVVTWNTVIAAYAQHERENEAFDSFLSMQRDGCFPNEVTFTCILKACGATRSIEKGERIHDEIVNKGLLAKNVLLGTALVDMYAKCGALVKAHHVLKELHFRDTVSWSALISGYAQDGQGHQALDCFAEIQKEGLISTDVTHICVLKACGSISAVRMGKRVHNEILNRGLLKENTKVGNALVDMYAKCALLAEAQQVLDDLPIRNVVSWNALIGGYAQEQQGHQALNCYTQMQREGVFPDDVTFTCVVKACSSTMDIEKGKEVHEEIVRRNLIQKNVVLGNALVDMYAKCHLLPHAWQLLEELPARDRISWNAMITGYAEAGQCDEAMRCFLHMVKEGVSPNEVTFTCMLKVCGSTGAIDKGKQVHQEIMNRGMLKDSMILGTAIVDMYAKCGALAKAQQVLQVLPERSVVSWNALIAGYAQFEQGQDALECFAQMRRDGISPNTITFASLLKACGSIGAIDKGKEIHDEIITRELLDKHHILGNGLVDMYAKCGALAKAREVLEQLPVRDTVSWSALIAGYAEHGHSDEALGCFEQMQREGCLPNEVTLLGVLNACAHSGRWDEAQAYYENMSRRYGITPTIEHHTSMVVLLGCAGRFEKAMSVMKTVPASDRPSIWLTLLGACRKSGNVDIGRLAFDKVMELDDNLAAAYVLMTNIYAAAGMQEDAEEVEFMRTTRKNISDGRIVYDSTNASGHLHSFFDHSRIYACEEHSPSTHLELQ